MSVVSPPRSRWGPPAPKQPPESSVRLRLAVFVNSAAAFIGLGLVDPDASVGLALAGLAVGSLYSHAWRKRGNFWVKWLLAFGMLYALYTALDNLGRGTLDPRLALAQLLMGLQVLNAFDLPRRQNLRVSLLVGGILMVVTATLSRTPEYGWWLLLFALSLLVAWQTAHRAELGLPPTPWRPALRRTGGFLLACLLVAAPLFALAPRRVRDLSATTLPLSVRLPLPDQLDVRVRNAQLAASKGGTGGQNDRHGYSGFSDRLDLNVRPVPSEAIVLRVKADRPEYWRAMAFDRYDGRQWTMSEPERVEVLDGAVVPMKLTVPKGPRRPLVQTFYVEQDQANVIFGAASPAQLYFPTALVWRDPYGGLRSPLPLEKDLYYSVVSETPAWSVKALATAPAGPVPAALRGYMALPALSPRTRALFASFSKQGNTPYTRLLAFASHLQDRYPYRLAVAEVPRGREMVDFFLFEQRAGFCEQFATALAVYGRTAGIPTRLVTGYLPGDYNPLTGFYEVRGKHAHAWVEAWLSGLGWVRLEPTPGGMPFGEEPQAAGTRGAWGLVWRLDGAWLGWGGAGIGLALVALAWGWGLLRLRARRHGLSGPSRAYARLRRRLARLGVPADPADTPRRWLEACLAREELAPLSGELEAFVARYERARFGGEPEPELEAMGRGIERALSKRS